MIKTFVVGEKKIEAELNAALPYRFSGVFGKNYFSLIGKDIDPGDAAEFAQEILYLMAMSAQKADMSRLSFDTYLEWLEDFMPGDLLEAAGEVVSWVVSPTRESNPKE